jgi:hypothetical protein
MKPMKTDLKFTQAEVRHIICLLVRYPDYPAAPGESFGVDRDQWYREHERLLWKFNSIDMRKASAHRTGD